MSDLKEVLKRLPNLAPSELEQVRQRLSLLVPKTAPAQDDDWLWAGIVAELRSRGLAVWGGYERSKGYVLKAPGVRAHLLAGYRNRVPQRAECMSLGRLGAAVLASWLTRQKLPLGPKMMMDQVGNIPEALEAAFPGYWKAGLLGTCIQKH